MNTALMNFPRVSGSVGRKNNLQLNTELTLNISLRLSTYCKLKKACAVVRKIAVAALAATLLYQREEKKG